MFFQILPSFGKGQNSPKIQDMRLPVNNGSFMTFSFYPDIYRFSITFFPFSMLFPAILAACKNETFCAFVAYFMICRGGLHFGIVPFPAFAAKQFHTQITTKITSNSRQLRFNKHPFYNRLYTSSFLHIPYISPIHTPPVSHLKTTMQPLPVPLFTHLIFLPIKSPNR